MTMQRWLIAAAVTCVAATGCSESPQGTTAPTARRPQQAGPTNPLITAGHLAGVEAAGLTGDQRAMRAHIEAMQKDTMRSMHLADPSRRIDHEAARAAVRPLQGVQSALWIDNANLLVMVGGMQQRRGYRRDQSHKESTRVPDSNRRCRRNGARLLTQILTKVEGK